MDEYKIRKAINDFVSCKIQFNIDKYYEQHKSNLGFLLIYPLIKLENRFIEVDPNHSYALIDRSATSWFLSEINKRGLDQSLTFDFDKKEYEEYEWYYPKILKMYKDHVTNREILDMSSINKCRIERISDKEFEITTALVLSDFEGETAYYEGKDNPELFEIEIEKAIAPVEYTAKKYGGLFSKTPQAIRRLRIDIDKELLSLCYDRVAVDIAKMGTKLKSSIIRSDQEVTTFLSFIFYLAHISIQAYHFGNMFKNPSVDDKFLYVDKDWLINKT